MLYEEWKSRYKNLKNFNTVLQRCPRFWPLAPPRGMNPGVYSLGISEDPPRYLSSKFDASVRSDCWDISIWKTLTQCDGNGNGNANANANVDDRGDYNSSPCTSYRRANKTPFQKEVEQIPFLTLFSSPEQCSWRAVVLPSASVLALASTNVKVLRPHYFLTLSLIWFNFGMMIHTGPNFCAVPSPLP